MTLLLIAAAYFVGFLAIFLGGSLYAQSFLYNVPTAKLPLRALVSSLIVTLFIGFWSFLQQKSPGKYNTIFEFTGYETIEVTEFEAIRKNRAGKEEKVQYKLRPGGKTSSDFRDTTERTFSRSDTDTMVVAIVAKEAKDATATIRFIAPLDDKGAYVKDETRFIEDNGRRFLDLGNLTQIVVPRGGQIFVNLLLNLLLYVVLFVVIWLGLDYAWGHAVLGALAIGTLLELVLLPLCFSMLGA